MRLKANKPIKLRGKTLGGENPLICIPIVAKKVEELKDIAKNLKGLEPDIIEWRVDHYNKVHDVEEVINTTKILRNIVKDIPLIFTFRNYLEGGFLQIEDNVRFEIIKQIIKTGEIDVVDIELISGKNRIDEIKSVTNELDVPLILSYHNFTETPSAEFLVNIMQMQILNGADIAKIAVMPNTEEDVLNLLQATLKVRRQIMDPPLITMSMGERGVVSRIVGCLFGSDLTFGSAGKLSAPGQIPFIELKKNIESIMHKR